MSHKKNHRSGGQKIPKSKKVGPPVRGDHRGQKIPKSKKVGPPVQGNIEGKNSQVEKSWITGPVEHRVQQKSQVEKGKLQARPPTPREKDKQIDIALWSHNQ